MKVLDLRALITKALSALGTPLVYAETVTVPAGGAAVQNNIQPPADKIWIFEELSVQHNEGANEVLYLYALSGASGAALWYRTATTDTLYYPFNEMGMHNPVILTNASFLYTKTTPMTAAKTLVTRGRYFEIADIGEMLARI